MDNRTPGATAGFNGVPVNTESISSKPLVIGGGATCNSTGGVTLTLNALGVVGVCGQPARKESIANSSCRHSGANRNTASVSQLTPGVSQETVQCVLERCNHLQISELIRSTPEGSVRWLHEVSLDFNHNLCVGYVVIEPWTDGQVC